MTPSLSGRKTAKLELSNGLRAYLISDPEASQSAAALSIGAGSLFDPPGTPGMAHFVEHLLFMGSEKYPQVGEYSKWLRNHHGFRNAYTLPSRSVYTFSVDHRVFPEALDRFSSNFISPLFSQAGFDSEICAIEQEKNDYLEHHQWRFLMVLKAIANVNHPFSQFSIGSQSTLEKISRDELLDWYHKHYSADLASVVLYSPLSIEELKSLVVQNFCKMPKACAEALIIPKDPISSSQQKGALVKIGALKKHSRTLHLRWELPHEYDSNFLNCSAHILVARLLESEHLEGLRERLKIEGLADCVSPSFEKLTPEHRFFSVSFNLTPKGVHFYEEVIALFYQYLHYIQEVNIPSFLFKEYQTMLTLNYEYQQRMHPFLYVEKYADLLAQMPLELFPEQTVSIVPFDTSEKDVFLSYLNPELATYFLIAESEPTAPPFNHKERWFGVDYSLSPIDNKKLAKWRETIGAGFSLPKPSPFIPKDLVLQSKNDQQIELFPTPICLEDGEHGKAFFWQDNRYFVPEVYWLFRLHSLALDGTPKKTVLRDLFFQCINDKLRLTLEQAARGKLSMSYGSKDLFDMTFCLSGYSEKAPILLREFIELLIAPQFDLEIFEKQKGLLKNRYCHSAWDQKDSPLKQAERIMQEELHLYPPFTEKAKTLEAIAFKDLVDFSESFFDKTYLEAMLIGNLSQKEALSVWQYVTQALSPSPYPKEEHKHNKLILPSQRNQPQVISKATEAYGNASIVVLEHPPFSFSHAAAILVLSKALDQAYFDVMRTQKKMGYSLGVKTWQEEGTYLSAFMIQSSSYSSHALVEQTEIFLDEFIAGFEKIFPEDMFKTIQSSLVASFNSPPQTLTDMGKALNRFAFNQKEDFMETAKYAAALENLTYEEVYLYAKMHLSSDNPNRFAVALEGISLEKE